MQHNDLVIELIILSSQVAVEVVDLPQEILITLDLVAEVELVVF